MEITKFPNKLRTYRLMNGYSQKKAARLLKLADTSILSRWERGISYPNIVQLFRLARIYQVQPFELYDDLYRTVEKEIDLFALSNEQFNSDQTFYV